MPRSHEEFTAGPSRLGPVWRDANVRSGPSLESPVIRLLLPDAAVGYEAEGWSFGDEVVEGEHHGGVITSSVWFRLAIGGWSSAVNFEPETVAAVLAESATAA
ncbi:MULTISPECIES: hypothetical protein [Streptomyces]|uniref:hypothetical protein n=1 Tax=Streptomyces TaxID=1883 RepID=UPI0005672AF5|nr:MULTISPECIES: hypothetical protein [Streptomyces]AKL71115.1 hypothetical protein M444_37705 [Streptomyces sp. Mg1]MBP0932533.1 hypothetical protein [Streptomyces sp. KCTC 0041BP]MBP0932673.1 hypothetical protein [Streptomyces sp. KCTC 0041BP]OKI38130.1 hypothetical protein A6A28_31505 [Streptomyces sp. CB03578]OKI61615.1 hypothetical protein AMK15_19120 [Streptomyces sp. MJM1172]